jgi:hypothetical protein
VAYQAQPSSALQRAPWLQTSKTKAMNRICSRSPLSGIIQSALPLVSTLGRLAAGACTSSSAFLFVPVDVIAAMQIEGRSERHAMQPTWECHQESAGRTWELQTEEISVALRRRFSPLLLRFQAANPLLPVGFCY